MWKPVLFNILCATALRRDYFPHRAIGDLDCVSKLRLLSDSSGVDCGRKTKDQVFYLHWCHLWVKKKSPPNVVWCHPQPPSPPSVCTYWSTENILPFFPFASHCPLPSSSVVPWGTRAPYQPHSKQTAAGSGRLPGICLGEGRKRGKSGGESGRKKNEATSRVGGEVRCTGRNRKDDERTAGERLWESAHSHVCVCVCVDVFVCDLLGGLACRENELISPRCTVRFISLAGK